MKFQKYTNNLHSSELYREFERQAVKKGFFDQSEEQRVKVAAAEVALEHVNDISTNVSEDLTQDVMRLATAMRKKGFEKQASDIEETLVTYKKASSALYDVTVDKNKDIFEFAHREGENQIIEGAGELGAIETIETAAMKIRKMIGKEPTGNLPKGASLAALASLVKQADDASDIIQKLQFNKDYILKTIDGFISGLNTSLQLDFNNFQLNTPAADSLYRALGANPQPYYDHVRFHNAAFNGKAVNQQTIIDRIVSDPSNASKYLAAIGANYKLAAFDIELISQALDFSNNDFKAQPSVSKESQEDTRRKAQVVAQQILKDWEILRYNAERERAKASNGLAAWNKGTRELIAKLTEFKKRISGLKLPRDYLSFADSFVKFLPTVKHKVQAPIHALAGFGNSSLDLNSFVSQLERGGTNLLAEAKSAIKITDDATKAVRATGGRLASIQNKISAAVEEKIIPEGHGLLKVRENAAIMEKIVNDNVTGGKEYVLQKLAEQFDKYESYKDFDIKTQQLDNQVTGLIAKLKAAKGRGK